MKNVILTGALAVAILVAAESMAGAQVVIEYKKQSSNSQLIVRYNSGTYYGCGYFWNPWVYQGPTYSTFGGYSGYYPYFGRRGYYEPYFETRPIYYSPPSNVLTSPVSSERFVKIQRLKDIEDGIRKFKAGDYRGAVNEFREAFLADTDSGVTQLYLGLALAGTGDYRNADKAFRSAFESLKPEEALAVGLPELLKDPAKFAPSAGHLSGGVIAFLLGRKDAAKAELSKVPDDPAARKLLDHLGK